MKLTPTPDNPNEIVYLDRLSFDPIRFRQIGWLGNPSNTVYPMNSPNAWEQETVGAQPIYILIGD